MNNQINYDDVLCQHVSLKQGTRVFHYIFGELEVVKIQRVKTKYHQFNYVECEIVDASTISENYLNEFDRKISTDDIISFNEKQISEFLFINKADVIIKDERYVNKIYE